MPTVLWQADAKLQVGTIFSITPTLYKTNPPLDSGLVRSPPLGYISEGDESRLRKETVLQRQVKAMSTVYHYSVAFTPAQASTVSHSSPFVQ